MNQPTRPSVSRGWDTYWRGTRDGDSYAAGGARHPAIAAFWHDTLGELLTSTGEDGRMLDIATGSGAVIESLFAQADAPGLDITCVDISRAAIDHISERFPSVTGIVANARDIPLGDACCDIITSQFGMEYAGPEALDEIVRLLAPGGSLAMLMHIRPGIIFNECRASLDAVRRTQRAEFVERALRFFEAGFAAVRGADRSPYDEAGKRLDPAIREIESILADHGDKVAGGTIAKLYGDVERIHTRIQFYDPDEVIGWLRRMDEELDAYAARMESMCEAAADRKTFRRMFRRLEEGGITIDEAEPLLPADGRLAVAWKLRARRAGQA